MYLEGGFFNWGVKMTLLGSAVFLDTGRFIERTNITFIASQYRTLDDVG